MKSNRRQRQLAEKRARTATMKASGTSAYAVKRKWLDKDNSRRAQANLPGRFGFEIPFPKPWKGAIK